MEKLLQNIAALYAPENIKAGLAALNKLRREQAALYEQKRSLTRSIERAMFAEQNAPNIYRDSLLPEKT